MTPDDMEAVVSEWLSLAGEAWPYCVPVCEGEIDAIRALLLNYQERGRALERIAATPLLNDGGAQRRLGQVVTEARATLKGKSHDQ